MKGLRQFLMLAACAGLSCSIGCGGGSSHNQTITTSGTNVAPISVNLGPAASDGFPSADASFVSVTVCVPGTSNCQTIDDVLVDTGSSGLRILSSAFSLPLPQQNASDGNPVYECFPFVSGYTWGPVQTADVEIAGEKASSTTIEVIGTTTEVPSGCTSFGLLPSNSIDTLRASGILGIGLFAQDCGIPSSPTCPASANLYYECPSASSCSPINEASAQQVQNPVTLFATDNNGVIIELPAVPAAGEPSVSGSLVFGIGTQSNNGLSGAKVYTADADGNFTTTFNSTPYAESFIDSGSNGFFFPSAITQCPSNSNEPGFYCPATTQNLSATNQGANSVSGTVDFSVADAQTLFANPSNSAFNDLGGTLSGTFGAFDWGLPFFYGQNVFVAIAGANTPGGAGPYWAY
jgi:hypothetical protein